MGYYLNAHFQGQRVKKNTKHAQVHYVGILNAAINDTQADSVP